MLTTKTACPIPRILENNPYDNKKNSTYNSNQNSKILFVETKTTKWIFAEISKT